MGWFPPYELVSGTDGLVPTLRLLLQTRMGWFPPYETWRDLLTPGSSSQEHTSPHLKRFRDREEKTQLPVTIYIRRIQAAINKGRQEL